MERPKPVKFDDSRPDRRRLRQTGVGWEGPLSSGRLTPIDFAVQSDAKFAFFQQRKEQCVQTGDGALGVLCVRHPICNDRVSA